MPVPVRYFTDPACPMSWGWEPVVRRLMVEFGDELQWKFVMGGLGRDYKGHEDQMLVVWLEDAAAHEMPMDPLLWKEGAISSTYPACMAVKAAAEQGTEAAASYLRAVREGLMCFRRKLDNTEALVEEARRAGLDVQRFRVDLGSHAIVEAFGADLDLTRDPPAESPREDRVPFPTLQVGDRWFFDSPPFEEVASAIGAAARSERPGIEEALRRFRFMATAEVQEVCGLAGPRAGAELWRLAAEWRVKHTRVLTGDLWSLA